MAKGEGASLLIRGYVETKDSCYLEAAKKALDFILKDISERGRAGEDDENFILYEFTCFRYVYNCWIFSIFGLIDYVIEANNSFYKEKLVSLKDFHSNSKHNP